MNWRVTPTQRLLSYHSIAEWRDSEQVPPVSELQGQDIDLMLGQLSIVREELWKKHLDSLTDEQRAWVHSGQHPSTSWKHAEQAQPYAQGLQEHLAQIGFCAEVSVAGYHADRVVLDAKLASEPGKAALHRSLPWLFLGFQVKYRW